MTDRRSSIDLVNSKYTPSNLRTSNIAYGHPSHLPIPAGVTTFRRSTIGHPSVIQHQGIVGSRAVAAGFRRSQIVTPPVYEVVTHPPVIQTITTPGKVYEIVTPIIDVTPDTVVQQTVTRTGQEGRLWAGRDRAAGCPWWCWLLLCLLLLALLLGGLWWLYNTYYAKSTEKYEYVEPIVQEPLVSQPKANQTQGKAVGSDQDNKAAQPAKESNNETKPEAPKEATNETDTKQVNSQSSDKNPAPAPAPAPKTPRCPTGSFLHNGKCLRCPPKSTWDGFNCVRKIVRQSKFVEYKTEGQSSGDKEFDSEKQIQNSGNSNSESKSSESSSSESSSSSSSTNSSSTAGAEKKEEAHHLRHSF